jgi:hypothetical protein
MPLIPFLAYSTGGTILWVSFLTFAGYQLGKLGKDYALVDEYLAPVSKIVVVIIVIWFILWIIKKNMQKE